MSTSSVLLEYTIDWTMDNAVTGYPGVHLSPSVYITAGVCGQRRHAGSTQKDHSLCCESGRRN